MRARIPQTTSGLVLVVSLVFVATTVVIGSIADWVTHEALERQLDDRIASETAVLTAEASRGGLARLADAIRLREAARSTASLDYLLVDDDGKHRAGELIADLPLQEGYEEHFRYVRDDEKRVAQALTTTIDGGTLVVAADRVGLYAIDRTLMTLFVGTLAVMLAVGIGSAGWIGWITRRRLAHIDGTARAIIDGELARRVPRDGTDSEFDRLAGTLNEMLDRISRLMDNLRQVSSDVAHDLRTPLTRLCNSLDRALEPSDSATQRQEVERARAQAADLLEVFAALLRISEIEGMAERIPRQRFELSPLIEQMVESYRPDMEESGHILGCSTKPGIFINGDRRLLNQVIANLLDNVLRHTPSGTRVTVSTRRIDGQIQVVVSDDGAGVAPAETERLFQRFARAERARSTPGHGLGLALVAAVLSAHGGNVWLAKGEGFRVVMAFPEA